MTAGSASIVIINWNGAAHLDGCLAALQAQSADVDEVVVVDNASHDDSVALVRSRYPHVKVISNERNLGYAGGANTGLRETKAELVILLNPDVELHSGTLAAIKQALADVGVGVVGGKLLYPGGELIQHAGGVISFPLATATHSGYREPDTGQCDQTRDVDYVTGALFALRRDLVDRVGRFDEGFYPAYFEEVDYCFRVRKAGYAVRYVPEAVATHHEYGTLGEDSFRFTRYFHRNRLRLVLKHRGTGWFLNEFITAEKDWLRHHVPRQARCAYASAYLDVMLDYPYLCFSGETGSRRPGAPASDAVLQAIAGLRESVWRVEEEI